LQENKEQPLDNRENSDFREIKTTTLKRSTTHINYTSEDKMKTHFYNKTMAVIFKMQAKLP